MVLSGVAHAELPQAALDAVGMAAYIECLKGKGMAIDKAIRQSTDLKDFYGIKHESVEVARISGIHIALLPYLRADCRIDPLKRQEGIKAINIALSKNPIANEILSIESRPSWFSNEPSHWAAIFKPTLENNDLRSMRSSLTSGLLSIGVPVEYRNTCRPALMGYYNPRAAVIVICTDNHASESELLGTLAHETVHAVQDCIEGRIGDGLLSNVASALRRHGGPKEMQIANEFDSIRNAYLAGSGIDRHIFNNYLSYDKELESEAWAIESVPSHVSGFIDACRSLQLSGVELNSK